MDVVRSLFCILIFAAPSFCDAQPYIDIFKAHGVYSPQEGFFRQKKEDIQFYRIGFNASLPFEIKKHYLVLYPGFEKQTINNPGNYLDVVESIYLPISFVYSWNNDKWKTAITYIPRLNGDLDHKDMLKNYVQNGGAILFIKEYPSGNKIKFGAYVNDEFFGFFALPLIGVDWDINSNWQLYGTLPREMFLIRKLGKLTSAGLTFKARTNSYYIPFMESAYYDIRENQLKLYVSQYVASDLVLFAEAGHTFFRKTEFHSEQYYHTIDVNDSFIFNLGIAYRVNID